MGNYREREGEGERAREGERERGGMVEEREKGGRIRGKVGQ